jgi:chromosome segregation ATPase
MRKNEELESELVELGAKCERTAIFLSMTERARNNLEESNSKLEAELDALKAQVQQQNLREGHIDSNHTETEGQSTTGEELTTISFIPRVRRLSENSNAIVQQARVLALTKSYEDLRAESEQRHSDIKQLKGVVLKLKTKAKEQELHRNVLEKRINIMSESMTSKCVEINEAREAHESLSLQLATVSELNGALLFQLKLASDGKVSCAESLESQRMREEELLMRLLVVQEINIDQNKILIALNNEIQCIKREDPVLLQQLRFDIFTLHAQKNHCEAKVSVVCMRNIAFHSERVYM